MGELRNPQADRWDLDRAFREAGISSPFPRGITFADVDSETEINGHFLVIEGKREHEKLSPGQSYTMAARARDGRTCLVIYGTPPVDVTAMQLWGEPRQAATLADVHDFVLEWAQWADAEPRPMPRPNRFLRLRRGLGLTA